MFTKKRKGQALVEMAIVLPMFLVILLGIVDFARCFHCWSSLNHMCVEAARVACKRQNLNLATTIYTSTTHASPEMITNEFWKYLSPLTPRNKISWGMAGVGVSSDTITISATLQFDPWFPFAGKLLGGQGDSEIIPLAATVNQKKE